MSFPENINILANGHDRFARRFKGYIINGFRFRTNNIDKNKTTQNSGVVTKVDTVSYASAGDKNPHLGEVAYYGVLTDVIEIRYTNDMKFVLLKCDWVNNQVGKKQDQLKFPMANFNHLLYKDNQRGDEPFILASQAEQVCYVQDPIDPNWHVVLKMTVRDFFDMYSKDSSAIPKIVPQVELHPHQQLDDTIYMNDKDVNWVREWVDGTTVDTNILDDDVDMEECD